MALIDRLNAIGDAIREKNGTTELIPFKDMPQAILDIESGGASLNIAYGDTPPEDTSKLWIKANEPQKLTYGGNIEGVSRVDVVPAYLDSEMNSYKAIVVKIENKIYIFRFKDVYIYDTETHSVTKLEDALPSIITPGCGYGYVEDKKIYLFVGNTNGYIYVFDTETNTATQHTTVSPFKKQSNGIVKVGNELYSFGGNGSKDIIIYNLDTETSTTLSVELPIFLRDMCCETFGTKVYLFGGYGGSSSSNYKNKDAIYVFDTETKNLQTLGTVLPVACTKMGSCRIGTKVYLFGGSSDDGYLNTINVFDIETETIETLETTLPNPDSTISCYGEGTKIYLLGGYKFAETIAVFALTHDLQNGNVEIETAPLKNKFNIINTNEAKVEIGVENVYIGNENNEAEVAEAYLHNGTDWVLI